MAYDLDSRTIDSLTAEGSVKWSRFPGTIGMWVAEMDFGISPEIRDYLISEAERGTFGYLPSKDTRQILSATSQWFGDCYGWYPDPEKMLLIPEVLAGLRETIRHYTAPGSAVVVPTPAYMPFLTIPGEFDRDVIEVPSLRRADGSWCLDEDGIAAALEAGAGLVVLCNPWNPTGRCFTRPELERLSVIVASHGARVFEDAIHAPLIFDGSTYIPYASISEEAAAHTITAVAASKGWNIPGLKCAQLIFHTEKDWQDFQPYAYPVSEPTSTTGARAAGVAFASSQEWIGEVREYLEANRDYLESRVASWDGVTVAHTEGTYIAFLDFTQIAETGIFGDSSPAAWLRSHATVAFTEGALCGHDYANFARIIFATPRAILAEALDRVERALYSENS